MCTALPFFFEVREPGPYIHHMKICSSKKNFLKPGAATNQVQHLITDVQEAIATNSRLLAVFTALPKDFLDREKPDMFIIEKLCHPYYS